MERPPGENLLARFEQSLRQSRAARMHLAARLRELEAEADSVRAELAEMDLLTTQTEAAIYRLLSSVIGSGNFSSATGFPTDAELEAAMHQATPPGRGHGPAQVERRPQIPIVRNNVEALSDRFMDRDRKSTRLNSSHSQISYAVFCLKKKKDEIYTTEHAFNQNHYNRSRPINFVVQVYAAYAHIWDAPDFL